MEPRIQYAKTSDGVSIAFTILGSGAETLVGASSIWGDLHTYKEAPIFGGVFDALADRGRRMILYDSRDTGSSEHRNSDYSQRARLADLEAVVDHVGVDRFSLYGFLHGGLTATAYTVANPERIERLVLANPFAKGADFYTIVPEIAMLARMRPTTAEEERVFQITRGSMIAGFADPKLADQMSTMMNSSMSIEEATASTEALRQCDISGLLTQISVPTMILFSHFIMPAVLPLSREVATLVPGAEFVEIGVHGALFSPDTRAEWLEVVDTFLRGGSELEEVPENAVHPASALRIVLFTDLVGHSEMMSRLGDTAGREVLREHERVTRKALAAHGGAEVKTMGDGFMASFGSVTNAVECAIDLQKAIAERNISAAEPLNVRAGINAGEPIEEDGDLFGATVILAARIAARAEGGEILVADTVRGLSSGKGFMFADRGEFVAKGFEDPVRVYEVRWGE